MAENLSRVQKRAYIKLSRAEWMSAYDVNESLSTLNALVRKGYAVSRCGLGSMAFPRNGILFKRVEQEN